MAFINCFNRHFADIHGAARARRALLFLCRFHAAISTFIKAARLFRSSSSISFQLVKVHSTTLKASNTSPCTISDVLKMLGAVDSITLVKQRFERDKKSMEDINKDFNKFRCELCRVYAEIQLIHDYESWRAKGNDTGRVHPYIGSSKLCCYLCSRFLRRHKFFDYRGCHWKIYHRWTMPSAFAAGKTSRVFEENLRGVFEEMVEHVRSLVEGKERPSKQPLSPETALDLSTVATVSSREISEMTLEGPWSRQMWKGWVYPSANLFPSPFDWLSIHKQCFWPRRLRRCCSTGSKARQARFCNLFAIEDSLWKCRSKTPKSTRMTLRGSSYYQTRKP